MKFELLYISGFSDALVKKWTATIFVGRRGSFSYSYRDRSGAVDQDKALRRHDFGLDARSFERLSTALGALPEKLQDYVADDAPTRYLRCTTEALTLERRRFIVSATAMATANEREFDRIWFELFALVQRALANLGIDSEILSTYR